MFGCGPGKLVASVTARGIALLAIAVVIDVALAAQRDCVLCAGGGLLGFGWLRPGGCLRCFVGGLRAVGTGYGTNHLGFLLLSIIGGTARTL